MNKQEIIKHTTHAGTFEYPFLFSPQTTFDPDGVYKVNVIFEDSAQTEELVDLVSEAFQKNLEETTKRAKQRKKTKPADLPFYPEINEAGEETGRVVFKFKCKAGGTRKDGSKWSKSLPVFDAKGRLIRKDPMVGNGTLGKVSFSITPFYVAATGAGVSLRLEAVQILELVEYRSAGTADSFGFAVEEGFDSSQFDYEEETQEEETFEYDTEETDETDGDF